MVYEGSEHLNNFGQSADNSIFLTRGVNKGSSCPIRIRFDALLSDHGLKWSDVYHRLGISKSHASMIRNGHIIPPLHLRIKIAAELKTDSSCLWTLQDLDYDAYMELLKEAKGDDTEKRG